MMEIPVFEATDGFDEIRSALSLAGCAVIQGVRTSQEMDAVRAELAGDMAATEVQTSDQPKDFYPAFTRRLTAIMARSSASHDLALDPTINALCQDHLGGNCDHFHLHATAALEVGPGAREQVLHREEDTFTFFEVPRPNLIMATMWALSDFKRENGATLVVPGSHRWPAERKAEADEVQQAVMPKGSVLIWLGGTLHAAGANSSDEWRYGVTLTYSLGWLRQEENQYLDLPPHVAMSMSKEIRALAGYPMHGALGFYDPRVSQSHD